MAPEKTELSDAALRVDQRGIADGTQGLGSALRNGSIGRFLDRIDRRLLLSRHGTRWRLWDAVIGMISFGIAWTVSPHTGAVGMPAWYYLLLVGGIYGVFLAVSSQVAGVPMPEDRSSGYELFVTCSAAVVVSYVVFSTLVGLVLVRFYGRYIVLVTTGISLVGIMAPRSLLSRFIQAQPINILLYGAGSTGRACCRRLAAFSTFRILGFLDVNTDYHDKERHSVPVLGGLDEYSPERLVEMGVGVVVICVGGPLRPENASRLLQLPLARIEVLTMGAFIERYFKEITLDYDSPQWFASAPSVPGNMSIFAVKRVMDIAGSLVGLALTLPFWPIVALLIKLDSPGPTFFRQTRVGRFGAPFTIRKFRTMRQDAEENGAQWAVKDDPRVTKLGRFLRLTRIDEVPQFLNVLKGEMSLVGPRPERPEFVDELQEEIPFYRQRHLVPPGLTGWAQIRYRYGASKEDAKRKLEFDLYYVRHLSTKLDVEIILKTLPMLMQGSR